jgi:SAM-dependent methyltransferase
MQSEHWKAVCRAEAGKLGVSPEIHPEDFIYHFLRNTPDFREDEDGAVRNYFQDGRRSARNLRSLLSDVCRYDGSRGIRFLEFASGYGCVTRHLADEIPFLDVTACDMNPQAVRFLRKTLGTNAVLSAHRPEEFALDPSFDVVFALSFFSHMPKNTFAAWLGRLISLVKPGGFLIFTTHGVESKKKLMNGPYDEEGFSFSPHSERKDLDASEYGVSAALSQFVFRQLHREADCRTVYFREGYWWAHQDVFIVRREAYETPPATESGGKDRRIRDLEAELAGIYGSRAFGVFRFLRRMRSTLIPYGSRRERVMFAVLGKPSGTRAGPPHGSPAEKAPQPKKRARSIRDLAAGMTDKAYLRLMMAAAGRPVVSGVKLPGLPSEQIQRNFVGSAGNDALQEGFIFYQAVKQYCKKLGVFFGTGTRVLDFGCGWGRISRFFFKDIDDGNFFGVDVDPKMIAFCTAEMGHGRYRTCRPEPPLDFFDAGSLDVIFAYSVFSHLAEAVARKWIEEFARLLRPGGIFLATTQRRSFLEIVESLQQRNGQEWDHIWHKGLAQSFIPIEKAREDYDAGKFLFSSTGGGEFRDRSFYGEALIPKRYIEREYARFLTLRDFLDSYDKLPQALFVMQKET